MIMVTLEMSKDFFAERLAEFLDGKSILAGSKVLGVPERTLNAWMRKETVPSLEHLLHLAQRMNCSIDFLVGLRDC